MLHYHTDNIRTIALVGHRAAGKTSLVEAILHKGHAVERLGSVDEETSISDYEEEEHRHHFSIDTSILHVEHAGKMLHLLDAPGYPDFVGATMEALNAVETAVIVISATNGIEVNTVRMFDEAGKHHLARIMVINKLDSDNIDFPLLIKQIQQVFGKGCILLDAPIGVGNQFQGLVSVLDPPTDISIDTIDLVSMRNQLIEAIVESDERLLERYLEEGDFSTEELVAAMPYAISSGTLIPIFCCAAKKELGIDELLDALSRITPSPEFARMRQETLFSEQTNNFEATETSEFIGQVFKTINDRYVGNLAFIRILSGKMDLTQPIINLRTGKTSRINHLLMMQGKQQQTVIEAFAGDIVAVAKVEGLHIGDTICYHSHVPKLRDLEFPKPMFGLAIEPKSRGDEQKISQSLTKIAEEDPTFKVTHDPQTHELLITGVSQLHLDVIQHRLKSRYDLEVITREPKIPYRETILKASNSEYRHKKQSGGRGQFGEVHMRIYPLSRDIRTQEQLEEEFANKSRFEKMRSVHYDPELNFAFIDHIVGGSIPNQFIPAVEKGCREIMVSGAIAGFRLQDIAVEVHMGKSHPVDSSEAAFKIAGRQAFRKAILAAQPLLLEPIVHLEVIFPSRYMGTIVADLNTKRGRVENQETRPGEMVIIYAEVPLSELTKYPAQLGSITQGQGSFQLEFSRYDQVPSNLQQQLLSKFKMAEHDEE